MGQLIPLVSKNRLDEAWDAYADLACELIADRSLIANRVFMERLTKLEATWKQLFLVQERS